MYIKHESVCVNFVSTNNFCVLLKIIKYMSVHCGFLRFLKVKKKIRMPKIKFVE